MTSDFFSDFLNTTERNPLNPHERVYRCAAIALQRVHGDKVQIHMIRALVKQNGHGTATLRWLCWLADKHGVTLVGVIEPTGRRPRLSRRQLKKLVRRSRIRGEKRLEYEARTAHSGFTFPYLCSRRVCAARCPASFCAFFFSASASHPVASS